VAHEQAVSCFVEGEIKFTEIPTLIENACANHHYISEPTLEDLLALELWATEFVNAYN
jgi:1-deoxy-D-xylulose-5-phosphate reductoisomerase